MHATTERFGSTASDITQGRCDGDDSGQPPGVAAPGLSWEQAMRLPPGAVEAMVLADLQQACRESAERVEREPSEHDITGTGPGTEPRGHMGPAGHAADSGTPEGREILRGRWDVASGPDETVISIPGAANLSPELRAELHAMGEELKAMLDESSAHPEPGEIVNIPPPKPPMGINVAAVVEGFDKLRRTFDQASIGLAGYSAAMRDHERARLEARLDFLLKVERCLQVASIIAMGLILAWLIWSRP